jgi:hypothetical protein
MFYIGCGTQTPLRPGGGWPRRGHLPGAPEAVPAPAPTGPERDHGRRAKAFLSEEPLEGFWFDRTREGAARRRGQDGPPGLRGEGDPGVGSAPLLGSSVVGGVPDEGPGSDRGHRAQDHPASPGDRKDPARPRGHSGSESLRPPQPLEEVAGPPLPGFPEVRQEMWEAYELFVAAFREAAERLKNGHPRPGFPDGSFPPGAPFVGIPLPVAA